MILKSPNRPGMGLTEVLVALFVMAIGMISLLTLFPLGAVTMGRALRDDRVSQTAQHADAIVRLWWETQVVEAPGNEDAFFYPLDNPDDLRFGSAQQYATALPPSGLPPLPATSTNSSYPVLLDPIGYQARSGQGVSQFRVGRTSSPTWFPRRTSRLLHGGNPLSPPFVDSFRACTLLDDLTFAENATADTSEGGRVIRQGRYNWSAIIQRQNNNIRNVANLTVLVFADRPPGTAPANAEMDFKTEDFETEFKVGESAVKITVDVNDPPPVFPRSWVMDGTESFRNAKFYRVENVNVTENRPTEWTLELSTPITAPLGTTGVITYPGRLYVFRGLAEVFERPQLKPSDFVPQQP
jgi:hypothetical protein